MGNTANAVEPHLVALHALRFRPHSVCLTEDQLMVCCLHA